MAGASPFSAFEWQIAGRYLRARKRERTVSVIAVISFLGIMLGVATLIIVMSVMNGFRKELLSKMLGMNGHVTVQSVLGAIENFDALAARLRDVPGVVRAVPLTEGQVMVRIQGAQSGAQVRGIRREDLASLPAIAPTLSPGALDAFDGGNAVIIGEGMAQKFGLMDGRGLFPGARITLIGSDGPVTAGGPSLRRKTYDVVGTFKIGMTQIDEFFVFMPMAQAQLFFNREDRATAIEVTVTAPETAREMKVALRAAAGPGVRLTSWDELNREFFQAIQIERVVMFLILTLIVLVASLNVISGMIMLVKDKSGDIAILRTMGATRGAVLRVFLIAGASIGVIGTLAGVALGVAFAANVEAMRQFFSGLLGVPLFDPVVYFLSQLPAVVDPGDVTLISAMALGLSLLATLYPAWRAARIDPAEALRYE